MVKRHSSTIRYLVHLGLIILFIFTMDQLSEGLESQSFRWDLNAWLYYGSRKATGIAFGVLLALEYLHHEREKTGTWKINPYRLLILGIPALLFSFSNFLYSNLDIYKVEMLMYSFSSSNVITLFEVMLGYSLSTSLYKED